jgi:glutathione S-transferase
MALTIYGSPRSRTIRVLWTAEELGLAYEHVPLAADDPRLRQPDFLRINPAGAIPAIVDGDLALSESLAIDLYLAKQYGSNGAQPLYPTAIRAEAEIWRWTLWAQVHLEPWVQQDARFAELRKVVADHALREADAALSVLDRTLDERVWLAAPHFTIGDLNVAAVLSPSRVRLLDLAPHPQVSGWLARCYARPAAEATRRRFAL